MNYYDVHVEIPKNGYSIGIYSPKELEDGEVISLAIKLGKFKEKGDSEYVDTIEGISEMEYTDWFGEPDDVIVIDPYMWENKNSENLGSWYAVANRVGIIAYFGDEKDAYDFQNLYLS